MALISEHKNKRKNINNPEKTLFGLLMFFFSFFHQKNKRQESIRDGFIFKVAFWGEKLNEKNKCLKNINKIILWYNMFNNLSEKHYPPRELFLINGNGISSNWDI